MVGLLPCRQVSLCLMLSTANVSSLRRYSALFLGGTCIIFSASAMKINFFAGRPIALHESDFSAPLPEVPEVSSGSAQ